MSERCATCGQVVPARCVVCDHFAVVKGKFPTHAANHRVTLGADDRCTVCGLATKVRMGHLGHVYDHAAVLP